MPDSPALSKLSDHFQSIHTPVRAGAGGCPHPGAMPRPRPGAWTHGDGRTHIQGAGRIRQAAQLLTTAVNDAPAVTGTAQSAFITEGEYGPPRNAPDPAPMAVGIAYISGRKTREQHGHPRSPSSRDMNEDAEYALGPTSFHSLREAQELADVL